jgi:DNA repair protein RecO
MALELITEAIALGKEDLGEYDSRVFLYTKDFGKVSAKATSVRKITSKLSAHIEPLSRVTVRLVSKGDAFEGRGLQLVDALAMDAPSSGTEIQIREALATAEAVRLLVPEAVPDQEVWNLLCSVRDFKLRISMRELLHFFGFDPEFAVCEFCANASTNYFLPKNHFFVCRACSANLHIGRKELVTIS